MVSSFFPELEMVSDCTRLSSDDVDVWVDF